AGSVALASVLDSKDSLAIADSEESADTFVSDGSLFVAFSEMSTLTGSVILTMLPNRVEVPFSSVGTVSMNKRTAATAT
ncbi:hypothetical protein, partial [Salmonella enterica]|uniref:hypothetical protein n=1 Tax=Salmonella enterica TaxID=28901 RepID=UPI003296A0F7